MNFNTARSLRWRRSAVAFLGGLLVLAPFVQGVSAESARETTALRHVPADAGLYLSLLRNRQQYDALMNSRAVANLMALPMVQFGLMMAQTQLISNPQIAPIRETLEDPENKPLLTLAKLAVADEIFVYADSRVGDLVSLANEISQAVNEATAEAAEQSTEALEQAEGEEAEAEDTPTDDPSARMAQRILEVVNRNPERLVTPNLIVGFKMADATLIPEQLDRLERVLRESLVDYPQVVERMSREMVGGSEFLTLRLDGSLLPWDNLDQEALERGGEELQKLIDRVKKLPIVISIGMRDGYLMLAIGDSQDKLATWGTGPLLVDRPEMRGVVAAGDRAFTTISYVSESLNRTINSTQRQLDDMQSGLRTAIAASQIDTTVKQELTADLKSLVDEVKERFPLAGAVAGYAYLTDSGYEGFTYDWTANDNLDSSQTLTILEHVGAKPLFLLAGRSVPLSVEGYVKIEEWVQKGFVYAERIGLEQMTPENRTFYDAIRKELMPVVARMSQVNRELVVPSLQDGQCALIVDADLTAKQWHAQMPPAKQALPMLELATVVGVSDVAQFEKALDEYWQMTREVLTKLHEVAPEQIPQVTLPQPKEHGFSGGKIVYLPLSPQLGIDKQIAPNRGLSDKYAVFSLTPRTSKRLLEAHPLTHSDLAAEIQKPCGGAFHLDIAGIVDVVKPWVAYAAETRMAAADEQQIQMVIDQAEAVLKLIKCCQGVFGTVRLEEGATVSHFRWLFQDQR